MAQPPNGDTHGVALQKVDEPPRRPSPVAPKIVDPVARDEATTGETAGTRSIGRNRNARDEVGERVVTLPLRQLRRRCIANRRRGAHLNLIYSGFW